MVARENQATAVHGAGPLGRRGAHRLCVAPMMDWTDRHCRAFHRGFGPGTVLYTEMVTARALLHGDAGRLLAFGESEHPVALQLGGSDPAELASAARLGADAGYDEINLNVGCPSDRVSAGRFGACLMAEPALVADCVAAMRAAVAVPVTVKCRLGIDDLDDDAHFHGFVDTVAAGGCSLFLVHARKAILGGLSPKENREIPPLQYSRVHALAAARPELEIVLNGGLRTVADAQAALAHVEGVMFGREAYQNPAILGALHEALIDPTTPAPSEEAVLEVYLPYVTAQRTAGVPLPQLTRHLLGLFTGRPGARRWRRHLTEAARAPGAGVEVLREALAHVRSADRAAA